jgi:hypothetical protein
MDQCDISLFVEFETPDNIVPSEKETALFAAEFAQQKEIEKERRAKQTDQDTKKEARKKNVNV